MSHENTVSITVVRGDITRQADCDAIVNSANRNLRAGAGVCGAIYRAAGPQLEPCSVQLGPLALGSAVLTPGFNLPNRFIVHTLGPMYFHDPDPPGKLASAMRNTLLLADANEVERIAIPALSMGIFAYPPTQAVPILVGTAQDISRQLQAVREIRFVVLDDELFKLFSDEIGKAA